MEARRAVDPLCVLRRSWRPLFLGQTLSFTRPPSAPARSNVHVGCVCCGGACVTRHVPTSATAPIRPGERRGAASAQVLPWRRTRTRITLSDANSFLVNTSLEAYVSSRHTQLGAATRSWVHEAPAVRCCAEATKLA